MNKLLCMCIFLLGILSQNNIVFSQTQSELNADTCAEFKKIDSELNKSYKKILVQYKGDKIFISKLIEAQRKWLAFRNAHLVSIYPNTQGNFYGSINPMCRCTVLIDITHARLKQINAWVNGVEEGDACSGSIKIR